jgi:hypothetical protein
VSTISVVNWPMHIEVGKWLGFCELVCSGTLLRICAARCCSCLSVCLSANRKYLPSRRQCSCFRRTLLQRVQYSIIIPPQHTVKCNPHVQALNHRRPEFHVRSGARGWIRQCCGWKCRASGICNALHKFNDSEGSHFQNILNFCVM